MRCALGLLPALAALAAIAGCGGSSDSDGAAGARTSTAAQATATTAARAAPTTAGRPSSYVVVTSLLGEPLRDEPGCAFAKEFVPADRSAAYDGALTLSVRCEPSDGYTPTGQIVNREGSAPREITCRDATRGQSFCVYVPSTTVGLYFTGTDRAVVRRRLEHLIEVVAALPTGITPLQAR